MSDQKQVETPESKFWATQPVCQPSGEAQVIQKIKKEEVSKKAIPTPNFLKFEILDPNVPANISEIKQFLEEHYVGDSGGKSRFAYQVEFLQWWLCSQGNNISVGLRVCKTVEGITEEEKQVIEPLAQNELVGYISGVPMTYVFNGLETIAQSVDYLCVHRVLRRLAIAPLLIQEITRRSYKQGIFTAVFTAAFTARQATPTIPPILIAKYYHYLLNPIKLLQCNFSQKPHHMSERDYQLHYKLEYVKTDKLKLFRKMENKDVDQCLQLLNDYQAKNYKIQQKFAPQLFAKMFKNIDNVIQCFVCEHDKNIIAFTSFYIVNTQMLDTQIAKLHKHIRNGYFYHYAIKEGFEQVMDLKSLQHIVLHEMQKQRIDVGTCLDICKNQQLIVDLKMDGGDGKLGYHTFNVNWGSEVTNDQLGVVLV